MGRVIIFPTDTVYGIGTKIFDIDGIKKIYEIKNRPLDKPLACLCANLAQIESIGIVDDNAKKLINKFLPGGLTLILKSKNEVIDKIGYKTIGVRIPNHKLALEILTENGPMLTTSVNESGETPLNTYNDIYNIYKDKVDYIYNSDLSSSNVSSTVVLIDNNSVNILREGSITKEMILEALN